MKQQMKHVLLVLLLTTIANADDAFLSSGTGTGYDRSPSLAVQDAIHQAEENAQKEAHQTCSPLAAQLISQFSTQSKVSKDKVFYYYATAKSVGTFRCIKPAIEEPECKPGDQLCRTAWGNLPYCAPVCEW